MEWINIKNEIPVEGHYLFATKTGGVRSGFVHEYATKYKKPEMVDAGRGWQFTHWMPLPLAPNEI
jgi:hypothetical protein